MKKMMIILMIMTACLASPVFAAAPDGVTNPGFEDDTLVAGVADYWTLWGEDQAGLIYHTDDAAGANSGDDYFEIGRGTGGWAGLHADLGQEVAVTPGTEVTMSAAMRWADGETASDPALKLEFYATQSEGWDDGVTPFVEEYFTLTGSYVVYSLTTTVPAGMNYARATLVSGATPSYIDDIGICEGTEPCDAATTAATLVAPAPSGTFVDPTPGTVTLEWTNPLPKDSNDVSVTCDVWFVEGDADPTTGTKILADSTAETVTSGAITVGNIYSWRVDCTDPNRPDLGGVGITTIGDVWTFTTINTGPFAEAGFNENAWLNGGTATVNLNMNYNDDVDNYPGPLTRVISTTGGTFDTNVALEDPNTITFTVPGTYTVTLDVSDGDTAVDATDSFEITVYPEGTAENYLEAHYPFDVDASDATANNHDGTLTGDALISGADTQVGAGALLLDGTDDWVAIADSVDPVDPNLTTWADFTIDSDPNNQVTISVWIKPATWTADYTQIVSKGYPGGYRLTRGDYDGVVFALDLDWDGGVVYGSDIYQMGDGQWHHLVGTWDGGGSALYIDGNFQYRMPQPHGTSLIKNLSELQIGANDDADSSQHFNGLIDDVRIYSVGLSHAEVLKLYASQGGSGTCGLAYADADLNQDCVINLADFAKFASEWLDCRDINPFGCP